MKKNTSRPNILTYIVRFVIVCVVILISYKSVQGFQLKRTLTQLYRTQAVYQEQIHTLESKIKEADSDFYIEKKAREESDLAKPGDFVIKFRSR